MADLGSLAEESAVAVAVRRSTSEPSLVRQASMAGMTTSAARLTKCTDPHLPQYFNQEFASP